MKNLITITVVFLFFAPFINAQYSFLLKDQKCPFDTAVGIQIKTYRMESKKMILGDSLIKNLKYQLQLSDSIQACLSRDSRVSVQINGTLEETLKYRTLSIKMLELKLSLQPKDTWFNRNQKYIYFAAGFITSGAIIHFLNK